MNYNNKDKSKDFLLMKKKEIIEKSLFDANLFINNEIKEHCFLNNDKKGKNIMQRRTSLSEFNDTITQKRRKKQIKALNKKPFIIFRGSFKYEIRKIINNIRGIIPKYIINIVHLNLYKNLTYLLYYMIL